MVPSLTPLDLVNFGMAVAIWMVQIIVYPSFAYCPPNRLVAWHSRYSRLIALIVVPLMTAQLGMLAMAAYSGAGAAVHGMLIMVLMCWGVTFKYSVALHRRISKGDDPARTVPLLVRTNWPRTILWTAVFLVGLFSG